MRAAPRPNPASGWPNATTDGEQHARYVERLGTLGRRIRLELPDGTELVADAAGVELDGRLSVVDLDGHPRTVDVGDITHMRMLNDDRG